jgi:N-hydroxyarylamine O-acetyltransferase
MDTKAYLQRIRYAGSSSPDVETLRDLQLAHLLSVPFENLSIHVQEPILLYEEALFEKIISHHRGGFCYELNALFAALLREVGFSVRMLSAGVAQPDGQFGPEFDHMALLVSLQERWLVDVGFGDGFRLPLRVDHREVQVQGERAYRIDDNGNYLILHERKGDKSWRPLYRFTLLPHELVEFTEMCHYHQTSPESMFTRRRLCSVARPAGRVTLSDRRLIVTEGDQQQERIVTNDEYDTVLEREFRIRLKGRLMMKRILCYGDSNTWGYDPLTKDRFDINTRWTRMLGRLLGNDYEIIEEGLCGRTTVWDDPIEGYKNGREYLVPCLETHRPVDLVTIMLGTNDLKKRFSLQPSDIALGAGVLVREVLASPVGPQGRAPLALLLAPPPTAALTDLAEMFEDAGQKSAKFPAHFGRVAKELGCAYLDTSEIIVSSPLDGIHFEAGEHKKLGEALASKIKNLLE